MRQLGTVHIFFALVLVAVMMSAGNLQGQQASGSILGTVYDQQGAVISGAKVTITNLSTQATRSVVSDKAGNYQIVDLPIGSYTIGAEHSGFRKIVTDTQTLQINQSMRVDLKMPLGVSTEVIEVQAQSAGVDTVNSTIGSSVTGRTIISAPLNGRNVLDLALLQPGVTEDNPDDTGAGTFNVAGGRADSVTFLLDGGVNNNLLNNAVVYNPNPDAVAEFRILESNYNAEYGRNAGGIITVVTKSGTNSLHGTIFDFARNDAFNANSFFNKRTNPVTPREVLKRQQFGFTVGGPIEIPKVVHGKDRFFWFASYQGQRQTKKQTQSALNVFTPAELNGDFSANSNNSGIISFLQANPFFQPNPALAAQGIIDPTKINSVAQEYIAAGLIPSSPIGSLTAQGTATDNRNEATGKFDFDATPNDRFSVTLGRNTNPTLVPFSGTTIGLPRSAPGYPVTFERDQYFVNAGYTRIFTAHVLNDFRFTGQRANQSQDLPARTLPFASSLGIGITPDQNTGPTRLSFNQSGLEIGFSPQGPTHLINNTFSYLDTVSWTKGSHNMKFGASFIPYQNNTLFDFFVNGEFDFSGSLGGIGTNNDFADFLLGLPDFYLQFGSAPSNIRSKATYGFAQDEWHVKPNLVLTYGIRYEYSTPKLDTQGRSFSYIPGLQSSRFVNAPAGLVFPGDKGAPTGANFPDKNDWAPRFGFAWDPRKDGKTSVRGGFGVFYDILKGEDNLQFNGQAPFFGFAFLAFNPLSANPSSEVNYLTQPFVSNAFGTPNSFPSRPPSQNIDFNAAGFLPFGGGGVFFVDPHLRTPYSYQYNLSVQHEFTKSIKSELAYVGSESHKLTALVDMNPFIQGTTTRVANSNLASPAFSFLDEFRNVVDANYNGLEASITKQTSDNHIFGSTYFTLGYTFQKSIDNASGFRQRNAQVPFNNPDQFRAVSDFDVTHRLTFSAGWDLPFEHGWSSGPKALTKGWSLYPIVSWRTGFPLDVLMGYSQQFGTPGPSGLGDANLARANLVGNSVPTFDPRKTFDPNTGGGTYFLAGNFAVNPLNPGTPTYGSLPRNFFRGPGRTNFDLAIAKTTPLGTERASLEFRVEIFNVLNHAEFANPDTSFGSPTFGEITATGNPGALEPTALPRIIQLGARIRF